MLLNLIWEYYIMGQYNSKGALFFDIDGTLFYHGTGTPIGDSIEAVKTLADEGYKIYLTTYRGDENWPDNHKYGKGTTLRQLEDLGVPYEEILWNVPSPRILINDDGVGVLRAYTNEGFNIDDLRKSIEKSK